MLNGLLLDFEDLILASIFFFTTSHLSHCSLYHTTEEMMLINKPGLKSECEILENKYFHVVVA